MSHASHESENPHESFERDEPLVLNPWQANDPSGISGRPDAEPAPAHIRRLRLLVAAVVVLSAVARAFLTTPGYLHTDSLFASLFPLIPLLMSTAPIVKNTTQIQVAAGDLGKRGWQKMYNKFRIFYILFALGVTLMMLVFWLLSGTGQPIGKVLFSVLSLGSMILMFIGVRALQKSVQKYSDEL
ncbi:hypothetical protein [Rothia terrae]|uniref:hypothetical protein n=1 Tax=Rothia terrae TaxID=396015 RepID=UPI00288234B5|nr:hypothetical protein [Rothia terrae]MDT0189975.1 hypothetical protein [Rothia terrae]